MLEYDGMLALMEPEINYYAGRQGILNFTNLKLCLCCFFLGGGGGGGGGCVVVL